MGYKKYNNYRYYKKKKKQNDIFNDIYNIFEGIDLFIEILLSPFIFIYHLIKAKKKDIDKSPKPKQEEIYLNKQKEQDKAYDKYQYKKEVITQIVETSHSVESALIGKFEMRYLFTRTELGFYHKLKEYIKSKVDDNLIIFSKVRLADLIKAKKDLSYSEKISYFNRVNRKHIDYVITDTEWRIKFLIELDDKTHLKKKAQESDKMKNEIFNDLNIPLIRFFAWTYHNFSKLDPLLCQSY